MAYQDVFYQLADLGVIDVFIPFVLVFVLVFAVLQKIKLFGEKSKRYNAVIGLVMGLSVVFPHVLYGVECIPGSPARVGSFVDPVCMINNSLPTVSVIIVAVVMALLLLGVFGKRWEVGGNTLSGWIAILSFLTILFIFGASAAWWNYPRWLYWIDDPETLTLIVTILVFAIIIWFITKEDKEDGEDKGGALKKLGEAFSENFQEN